MNKKKKKNIGQRILSSMENEQKRLRQTSCKRKQKTIFKKTNLHKERIEWWFPEVRGVEQMQRCRSKHISFLSFLFLFIVFKFLF